MALKTALYDEHIAAGARMVEFAGYDMPVQYPQGISAEHEAVRNSVGIFDVSHMGEFLLTGKDSLAYLNKLLTNSFDSLKPGRVRYAIMCNEAGGALDDLIVYCLEEQRYLIVVNAANTEKDFEWMSEHLVGDCKLENLSDQFGLIAVQGPKSKELLAQLVDPELLPEKYYSCVENIELAGISCLVSQTGYTGEFGYEIYVPWDKTVALWKALFALECDFEVLACGLGARDTLRLEAAMPLYGHELSLEINPVEAGLGFALKFDKEDFIGKEALQATDASAKKRVGLVLETRGIVREGAKLFADEQGLKPIGFVTSGTLAPHLQKSIAMGYVTAQDLATGDLIYAELRKKFVPMRVVDLPFYKRGA